MSDKPDKKIGVAENVQDNIDSVADFYTREEEKISVPQNVIENISCFFSTPVYFVGFVAFVALWMLANYAMGYSTGKYFDEPPFIWLQGIVGLNGVLITIAVLIRQNRMARLSEMHAHLGLQVNLLADQKATKIIKLLEELRHDSPDVKDRADPEAAAMQMDTDPNAVLSAIQQQHEQDRKH